MQSGLLFFDAISVKQWRNDITDQIQSMQPPSDNGRACLTFACLAKIRAEIANYEAEYHKLKEATTTLELVLWKAKMNELSQGEKRRSSKRMKLDESDLREQCRISCGAGIVIEQVLPYLLPVEEDNNNSDDTSDEVGDFSDEDGMDENSDEDDDGNY